MRIWTRSIIALLIKISALFYISPANINYWWNFGALALFFLISQIITGIFLAMFYNPDPLHAYASVMYITNEVYYGWWFRALHANGASLFFLCVYVHIFRGLYYGSFVFPRQMLWSTGIIILILMIITAFLGYILPWGQMSFWGAMVITSLLSSLPLIGKDLIFLLWGGFTICGATLYRFYALHFILPFVIFVLVVFHIAFLHETGSTNKLAITFFYDGIPFSSYYVLKDIFGIICILIFLILILGLSPDLLGHSLNYEKANFLVTPSHIVPEWYLLFFYALLRSVPSKFGGFLLMMFSFFSLYILSYILKFNIIKGSNFKPWHIFWFFIFVYVCLYLSWIGGLPVMDPFLGVGRILSFWYFFILLVIFPLQSFYERISYDGYILLCKNFRNLMESRFMYYYFTNKFNLCCLFFFKKSFSSSLAKYNKLKLELDFIIDQKIENAVETKISKLERELENLKNSKWFSNETIIKELNLEQQLRRLYEELSYNQRNNIKSKVNRVNIVSINLC